MPAAPAYGGAAGGVVRISPWSRRCAQQSPQRVGPSPSVHRPVPESRARRSLSRLRPPCLGGSRYNRRGAPSTRPRACVRERQQRPCRSRGFLRVFRVCPYTAGLLASIGYDEPVRRSHHVRGHRSSDPRFDWAMWRPSANSRRAEVWLDPSAPVGWNQALMDLCASLPSDPLAKLPAATHVGSVRRRTRGSSRRHHRSREHRQVRGSVVMPSATSARRAPRRSPAHLPSGPCDRHRVGSLVRAGSDRTRPALRLPSWTHRSIAYIRAWRCSESDRRARPPPDLRWSGCGARGRIAPPSTQSGRVSQHLTVCERPARTDRRTAPGV